MVGVIFGFRVEVRARAMDYGQGRFKGKKCPGTTRQVKRQDT